MRERREEAAADEGRGEAVLAVLDPGEGEVLDVLGEREAGGGHPGIDHAVGDPVELALREPPHEQDEQALRGLLDDGRDEDGRERQGLVPGDGAPEHQLAGGVEGHGDEDGDEGAPEEGHDEVAGRLGLEAVQPHEGRHDDAQRDDRDDEAEQRGADPGGGADGHRDREGGDAEADGRDPEQDPPAQERTPPVQRLSRGLRARWNGCVRVDGRLPTHGQRD